VGVVLTLRTTKYLVNESDKLRVRLMVPEAGSTLSLTNALMPVWKPFGCLW